MRPAPALPDWPGLMGLDLACAYTQLSEDSFRFLARRRGVAPVDAAGLAVTRWARADLDRLIDTLPRRGVPMADTPEAAQPPAHDGADAAAAALQRARKRGKR